MMQLGMNIADRYDSTEGDEPRVRLRAVHARGEPCGIRRVTSD